MEPGDKSVGIKKIVDHLGGDYKDIVVFGDEKNDLSVFNDEWTSIAMWNAIDELKQKASYVTSDVSKDGIYKLVYIMDGSKKIRFFFFFAKKIKIITYFTLNLHIM